MLHGLMPLVLRELKQESRRPGVKMLRILCAGLMSLTLLLLAQSGEGFEWGTRSGGALFLQLNLLLFSWVWILVPSTCFDSISKERREGTLELLFMTPLTSMEVLISKGFIHGLRTGTCLLATAPVLIVPILLGGVAWADGIRMFCLHAAAGLLAWFATLVASVYSRQAARALAAALFLSVLSLMALGTLYVGASTLLFIHRSGVEWSWDAVFRFGQYFYQAAWNRLPFNQPGFALGIVPHSRGAVLGAISGAKVMQALGVLVFALSLVAFGLRILAGRMRRGIVVGENGRGCGASWWDQSLAWLKRQVEWKDRLFLRQLSVLSGRYGVPRAMTLVAVSVGGLGGYWWVRFHAQPSEWGVKCLILLGILAAAGTAMTAWAVGEERRTGMAELMYSVLGERPVYPTSLICVGLIPVLPSLLVVLAFAHLVFGSIILLGVLILCVANALGIAFVLGWRGYSIPASVLLALGLAWTVPWLVGHVLLRLQVTALPTILGMELGCLLLLFLGHQRLVWGVRASP